MVSYETVALVLMAACVVCVLLFFAGLTAGYGHGYQDGRNEMVNTVRTLRRQLRQARGELAGPRERTGYLAVPDWTGTAWAERTLADMPAVIGDDLLRELEARTHAGQQEKTRRAHPGAGDEETALGEPESGVRAGIAVPLAAMETAAPAVHVAD